MYVPNVASKCFSSCIFELNHGPSSAYTKYYRIQYVHVNSSVDVLYRFLEMNMVFVCVFFAM